MFDLSCSVTDERGHELQIHGTADFPCAAYSAFSGDYPWHWHDEVEVLYVVEGPLLCAVGSQRYLLQSGDGLFINSAVPHAAFAHDGQDYNENDIVFHPRLLYGSTDSVIWSKYFRPLLRCTALQGVPLRSGIPWQREAAECIQQAHTACVRQSGAYEIEARELLTRVCLAINEHCIDSISLHDGRMQQRTKRVKIIMDYIQTHYGEKITLPQLAKMVHVCGRECQREFKNIIGLTPMQYLGQLRLSEAARMLRENDSRDRSITDICCACGFQSPSYFAKEFSRKYGVTPQKYRRGL